MPRICCYYFIRLGLSRQVSGMKKFSWVPVWASMSISIPDIREGWKPWCIRISLSKALVWSHINIPHVWKERQVWADLRASQSEVLVAIMDQLFCPSPQSLQQRPRAWSLLGGGVLEGCFRYFPLLMVKNLWPKVTQGGKTYFTLQLVVCHPEKLRHQFKVETGGRNWYRGHEGVLLTPHGLFSLSSHSTVSQGGSSYSELSPPPSVAN